MDERTIWIKSENGGKAINFDIGDNTPLIEALIILRAVQDALLQELAKNTKRLQIAPADALKGGLKL